MKIIQTIFFSLFILGITSPLFSFGQEERQDFKQIPVYVFSREDCGHCLEEKKFLESLSKEDATIQISFLDIGDSTHEKEWSEIARLYALPLATPITLVGNTVIQGFDSPDTTGERIKQIIQENREKTSLSPREIIRRGEVGLVESFDGSTCTNGSTICALPAHQPILFSVPFFGITDFSDYSLPLLSIILGFLDGFNPCALWVLITFLIVLTQTRSRKRMLLIAGIFIFSESVLYWMILNIWFTTWNFVTLDRIVTPLIGILSLLGGVFFLYEWKQADGTCKIIGLSKRERFMHRIKTLSLKPIGFLMILGVVGLAFSVNIIEFACSIGIPQAFTKILEFNNLSSIQEQSLMGLYILFYMIDDLIVLGMALWSIDKIGLTARYTVWTNFIGGILMILLGFLFLFSPETLRFL